MGADAGQVLAGVPPEEFVDAWLALPKESWQQIDQALEERYSAGRLGTELTSEAIWAKQVLAFLEQRRDDAEGFERLRIDRAIPTVLRRMSE